MPFLLIDFPAFKPIAIELGPFAIRWYALAYICGIVFGWLYARSLLREKSAVMSSSLTVMSTATVTIPSPGPQSSSWSWKL